MGAQSQGNYRGRTTSRVDSMGHGEWDNGPGDNDLKQSGPDFAGCPGAISAKTNPQTLQIQRLIKSLPRPSWVQLCDTRTSRQAVTLHLSPLSGAGNE